MPSALGHDRQRRQSVSPFQWFTKGASGPLARPGVVDGLAPFAFRPYVPCILVRHHTIRVREAQVVIGRIVLVVLSVSMFTSPFAWAEEWPTAMTPAEVSARMNGHNGYVFHV